MTIDAENERLAKVGNELAEALFQAKQILERWRLPSPLYPLEVQRGRVINQALANHCVITWGHRVSECKWRGERPKDSYGCPECGYTLEPLSAAIRLELPRKISPPEITNQEAS